MSFPTVRHRRLRSTAVLRELSAEVHLSHSDFIAPLFINESLDKPHPLAMMEGHVQETIQSVLVTVGELMELGCNKFLLFGIPSKKDASGSQAWNDEGIVQKATKSLKQLFGEELLIITDCCLDEYTDHGHCGVLDNNGSVDNDATIELYGKIAVAQARSGSDVIAPSGMMDGQVGAMRTALDSAGFNAIPIMAYSAKYASCMYGPFREAAECAPQFGNRKGYQMNPANSKEAISEVEEDIEQGADIIIVKPALLYLDIIARCSRETTKPIVAYSVSGEYAMIHEASKNGAFNEDDACLEALLSIKRAGATSIITYYAKRACSLLGSS